MRAIELRGPHRREQFRSWECRRWTAQSEAILADREREWSVFQLLQGECRWLLIFHWTDPEARASCNMGQTISRLRCEKRITGDFDFCCIQTLGRLLVITWRRQKSFMMAVPSLALSCAGRRRRSPPSAQAFAYGRGVPVDDDHSLNCQSLGPR